MTDAPMVIGQPSVSRSETTSASGPAAQARLYGVAWRWHFLAATIVIPFVLWQSTTGTLYLWSEWWMDVCHPELRFVAGIAAPVPPSARIAAALASLGTGAPGLSDHHVHHGATSSSPPADHVGRGPAVQEVLLSDDPRRSTVVLVAAANGLPFPVFVDPGDARVLGSLTAAEWLPGLTRALHGGWPLGAPGSWLLELGDGWAIVMILTGWYLWWPRGRGIAAALWPRWGRGPRIVVRDLHAGIAVLFSAILLFFLVSALPWTAFWGGELLSRVQTALGQDSPAGFSPGGAAAADILAASAAIDDVAAAARAGGVTGTLSIRLSPSQGAPLYVANRASSLANDRTLLADAGSGRIAADVRHDDLPLIPRLVAVGVHVHQGDFGPVNLWLNTALALSLLWLSATGLASWWIRRPKGRAGVPPKRVVPWSRPLFSVIVIMCLAMPIFGLSVVAIAVVDKLIGVRAGTVLSKTSRG